MKRRNMIIYICALTAVFLIGASSTALPQLRQADDDDSAKIHRLHVLMNQGLIMFLDGLDLKMVSNMNMSTTFADESEKYASHSMEKGRKAIELALNGEQNKILVEQGFGDHPLMKTARELGKTMLELISVLEKMEMGKNTNETTKIVTQL